MPYIQPESRDSLIQSREAQSPGELNFLFTKDVVGYVERKGLSYQTINDVLGALDGARAEFYRRVAAPYEDQKIKENGDVY